MLKWKNIVIFIAAIFLCSTSQVSGETYISSDINTDTIWSPEGSPYIITRTVYIKGRTVNNLADCPVLTITTQRADGSQGEVAVKFYPKASLVIGAVGDFSCYYGALDAQGTDQYRITFTANGVPNQDFWSGISFNEAASSSKTKLKYCTVEYGGYTTSATNGTGGNININKTSLFNTANSIEQCIIRNSFKYGVVLNNSYGDFKDCQITGNPQHGVCFQNYSGGVLAHNEINHNQQCGVYCNATTIGLTINSNTFSANGSYPLFIPPATFDGHNSYINNTNQIILILGCQIKDAAHIVFPNEGIPYRITGTAPATYSGLNFLADQSGEIITVTVNPGVIMRFEPATSLRFGSVGGAQSTLTAVGTKDQPVTFTASEPGQYWDTLYFNSNYTNQSAFESRLRYCIIEYAGNQSTASAAAIYFYKGFPSEETLKNTTVRFSETNGIKIYKQTGGGTVDIHHNNIYNNALYDIMDYNNSLTINAELNYWGSPNGPSQDLCSSAVVSDTVRYEAWLEQEFTEPLRFTAANANPKKFNPLTQHTTFNFSLSQSAAWTLSVMNEQFQKVWSISGNGSSESINWNGVGDNGVVSGICYYRIEAQAGSTIASPAMGMLNVGDQTIARITQPTSGSLITPGTPLAIAGTAQTGTGGYYQVQYGAGEAPTSWTTIAGPVYSSKLNEELASWNTAELDQPVYTVKLDVHKAGVVYSDVVRVGVYLEEQNYNPNTAILYTYDHLGRLTRVNYPDGAWLAYTYDRVGNRVKVERSGDASLTAIKLSFFKATPTRRGVIIDWATETENNTTGFYLWRKGVREKNWQKITVTLIVARGNETSGATYSFTDIPPRHGFVWQYILEEVETNGKTKRYGPISSVNIALKSMSRTGAFKKSFDASCK